MGTKSKKSQKSKKNVKKPSAEKSAKNKSVKNKKVTTPSAEKPKVSTPEKKATTSPKPATTPDEPPATSSIGPISNPSAGSILGSSKPPGEKFAKNKKQPSTEKAPTPAGAPAAAAAVPTSLTALYNIETSGPGQALTAEELMKMKEEGKLAVDVDISMNPALYKVKDQKGEEHIVLVVDAPPCGCRKVQGKKERCRKHRAMKRDKKKSKKPKKKETGMVKDDDSDRKKVPALRHAEDSEEEADQPIDGAITPDKVCVVGPAGVAILIAIDMTDNPNAGPRAPADAKNMTGILIKGPQDCPQFLPDAKIPKDNRGVPKYTKYTIGTLVRNEKGEHIFFPEGGCKFTEDGKPINLQIEGVDTKVMAEVAQKLHVAGVVDVNENGMPIFLPVDQDNPAPQDKLATVGVLAEVNGETIFVQTKGQTVGSGDNTAVIPVTREGPQPVGTKLGEAVVKDGKVVVVPVGQAKEDEVVGAIVQGNYNQPVFIAKKGGVLDKGGVVTYEPAKATAMKEDDWKKLAAAQQDQLKAAAPAIEKTNVTIAAAVTGKTPEQIRKEMAEAKANTEGPQEVISQSIQQGCYDPNRSQFAYKAAKPAGGGGAAGGTGGGAGKAAGAGGGGAAAGGYQYGAGGEVKSMAFADQGGAGRSVFMK